MAADGRLRQDRPRHLLLLMMLTIPHLLLAPAVALDLPAHGCYWTQSCQSKWFGGCDTGFVIADQSENCNGLCNGSNYPSCLPFHTHYHCCKPEIPKATNRCATCVKKLDFGDNYLCCTDCSNPFIIDKDRELGYCKTGAGLSMQLKPKEIFKWVAGPWMKCSSPCDGGVRYRDVACYGSIDDSSIKHYPVDDSRCSGRDMPSRQESCNLQSCGDLDNDDLSDKSSGTSGWLVALLVFIAIVLIGGLGFAGYTYYKRRSSTPTGFVYIMLEGYS